MRTRKSQKRYIRNGLRSGKCPFCNIKETEPREIYAETEYFYRVKNIFGYDVWDGCVVKEHQLIIPKRHVVSLSALTPEEDVEYMELIKQAEKSGYNLYARSENGATKSVAHQHTHLIKFKDGAEVTRLVYVKKPHLLVYGTSRN